MSRIFLILFLGIIYFGDVSAGEQDTPFEQVFSVIAEPEVYATTWGRLLQRLEPLCTESTRSGIELIKKGNVECLDFVRATSFDVTVGPGDRVVMVAASFGGAENCSFMKKVLMKNFGKPSTTKDKCEFRWWLRTPKGQPQRFVGMVASTPDDEVYFSIGVEQGP